MEFVDGQPIHRWCDEHKLNILQRLELFRTVCSAVQYAHQRLVVHRDLKPGNILVTADGTVKLLDFGIAKLLDATQTEAPASTLTMLPLMTPEYASPEQAKGEAITTLTDVYSLGVVLYELLTGHRPYKVRSAAAHEIARVISEEEPTRPSDVVATTDIKGERPPITPETVSRARDVELNKLRKNLRGDLDSITLTALRKEPVRRYSSVEALSEDLRRHLENRPINAHQDSVWRQLSRLVRRHPLALAAALLILLSLEAGVIATQWGTRVALDATQHNSPRPETVAPELTLLLSLSVATFIAGIYLTRAIFRRVAGSLAGSMAIAVLLMTIKTPLDFAMGWWHRRSAGDPDPRPLLLQPTVFLCLLFAFASLLLALWRVHRHFGWRGLTLAMTIMAGSTALRDRVYWDALMRVIGVSPGVVPVAADTLLYTTALGIGYAVMCLTAGPPRADRLARKPLLS